MDADHPVNSLKDDKLGFGDIAKNLAKVIVDKSSKDGLVLGVDGPWGSGKSTLLNFTKEILKKGASKQEVVTFEPWLIGDRNSLILNLFNELGNAVEKINGTENKKLSEEIKKFSSGLSGLAKLAKLSGEPNAMLFGGVLESVRGGIDKFFEGGSIYEQKQKISKELEKLERPIVVFVDDLDRLEPQEVLEIFRVIRAVADFPNIVYVLSYDAKNVAKTLEVSLQIEDGHSYLEKIVQGVYKIPISEFLDLKLWMEREIKKLFNEEFQNQSSVARLSYVLNNRARKYIKTPRDVIRFLNALRMYGLPVRENINIVDMVWLQIIRIGNRDLFDWIEKYLTRLTSSHDGLIVTNDEVIKYSEDLIAILIAEMTSLREGQNELNQFIGEISIKKLETQSREKFQFELFLGREIELIHKLFSEKRISSPQHYKYYFSLCGPLGHMSENEVKAFIQLAISDKKKLKNLFSNYAREFRPQKSTKAELLIDHLISMKKEIPKEAIDGIISCLANSMDENVQSYKSKLMDKYPGWSEAKILFKSLLDEIENNKEKLLSAIFSDGAALGWLSYVFWEEAVAHGHLDSVKTGENLWIMTEEEFQTVLQLILTRYSKTSFKDILSSPNNISILYIWNKLSGDNSVSEKVKIWCNDPELLIYFVEKCQGISHRSTGKFYFLRPKATDEFIDFELVLGKLKSIIEDDKIAKSLKLRAQNLLDATKEDGVLIDENY